MTGPADRILAVGGSAGSLPGLCAVLAGLPADTDLAVVVCLHSASRDTRNLCEVLSVDCALQVQEAIENRPVAAREVYVAAGDYHLLIEKDRFFSLSDDEEVNFSRPSIDVTFDSVAQVYREQVIGVLLSGANQDGGRGLARIQALGGTTVVQSPESASSRQMPEAALRLITPDFVGTPEELAACVADLAQPQREAP